MKNTAKFVFFKNCVINDFNNTIFFETNTDRDNYFDTYFESYTSNTAYNYIRDKSEISVSHNFYDMQLCNYGYLVESKNNKRIYFRVIGVDYENDFTTRVAFAFDFIMTYNSGNQLLNNISNAQIDRRHVKLSSNQVLCKSIMNSGDIINRDTVFSVATHTHLFKEFTIVFTTSVQLESHWGNSERPKMPVSKGATYDKITSPQNIYQCSEDNFHALMNAMKDYPWIAQNITSVIKCPTEIFDSSQMIPVHVNDGGSPMVNRFDNGGYSPNYQIDDLKFSKNDILSLFNIPKSEMHNLRAPYFYVEMTNWQGAPTPIFFEKLDWSLADDDKSFLSFNVQTQLGFENKIKIYPINYLANNDNASDGVGRGDYLNTSIEFSGFDTVPVLIDNYKLSMSKSAYTRELSNSRQLTSQVRNVALGTSNNNSIQDRVSDAYSLIQNYGSKNMVKMGMNVVNGLQNEHQYYQQQQAQFNDMKIQTPSVTSQTNNNTFEIANNTFGITLKFKAINQTDYQSVAQYYKNFGYAYPLMGKVAKPTTHTIMDYLQVTPLKFYDNRLSSEMINVVSLLLQTGIKFWHVNNTGTSVFNQNLDNNKEI